MPRGQTSHLSKHQYKSPWKHGEKTVRVRIPTCFEQGIKEITQWVDSHENPQEAMQCLLETIAKKQSGIPIQGVKESAGIAES